MESMKCQVLQPKQERKIIKNIFKKFWKLGKDDYLCRPEIRELILATGARLKEDDKLSGKR